MLRYAPPQQDLEGAYGWLLAQQQADGGWGEPGHPLYRDVPTAAAVLALHARDDGERHRSAIAAGIQFLKGQHALWQAPLAEDIPIGIELILPRLLVEANAVGLALPAKQYDALVQLGEKIWQDCVEQHSRQEVRRCTPGRRGAAIPAPPCSIASAASASARRPLPHGYMRHATPDSTKP
ncbi:hypothetical protein ACFIOY_18020 [Bradyrhizobium sp. TZ2]